jgi:Holliday junction resolvasome RuvABC endonuclease subunit
VTPVLALDIATTTGWALRDRKGRVTSGSKTFRLNSREHQGMIFVRFKNWLQELITLADLSGVLQEPGVIAFEKAHHRGAAATEVLGALRGHVLTLAAENEIVFTSVHTATLKLHATGKGNAKKPDMIAAAKTRWPHYTGESDDEADALCVLAWALDTNYGEKNDDRKPRRAARRSA